MSANSIQEWQGVLQDIAEQKRHRLTGSEYKEVIAAIEAQPKDIESLHIARQLVAKLAQHQGHESEAPFRDQSLNRVFNVEKMPAAPAEGDERLRERVIAGTTIFKSREFDHTSEPSKLNDRGSLADLFTGNALTYFTTPKAPAINSKSFRCVPPRTFRTAPAFLVSQSTASVSLMGCSIASKKQAKASTRRWGW